MPVTVVVYTPVYCGLDHAIDLVVLLNVTNVVFWLLLAAVVALYTMSAVLQYVVSVTVYCGTVTLLAGLYKATFYCATVLAVIAIMSVVVRHDVTFSVKVTKLTMFKFLFATVPVTLTTKIPST